MDPIKRVTALDPARRAASLYDEFRQFAFKGNVVDLAVGVIIGAAFGKIVDSLVKNVMMPLIDGLVSMVYVGDTQYKGLTWKVGEVFVPYGQFLGEVVNFLIVAAALFLFVRKFLGWVVRAKEEAPGPPSKQEELLTEIRDLLKNRPA